MKGRSVQDVVAQAASSGVDIVQLREKNCSEREFIQLAVQFSEGLKYYGIPLIINDRVDIALQTGAQGVHLGQSDLPWTEARRILGKHAIVGISVETLEQAENLKIADIDYLGVSGVFQTATKPDIKT